MKTITTAMLLSVALPLHGERVLAQQTQTQIAVSGGVATDQRGVRSSAASIAPSITLQPSGSVALTLGGSATRFATEVWSLGGSVGLGSRAPLGRFLALTLNGSASASKLGGGAEGAFLQGDVVPALEVSAGPLTLFGGARAAMGRTSQPALSQPRSPVIGGGRTPNTVMNTTGAGPLYGLVLRAAHPEGGTVQVGAREERMRVGVTDLIDRSVTLGVAQGRVVLGGALGARTADDENAVFGSGTLSLRLTHELSLDVAAGRYPSNRVLDTPAGSYASAGLSLHFGRAGAPALPRPAGAPAPRSGVTRLAIRAPDARRVEVAGDFTEWKFVAAIRAANGVWYADVPIPPGQYRYAFRINGTEWRVPDGATAVDDGFGGKSAWITVSDRRVGR